jgi:hypothetical protein
MNPSLPNVDIELIIFWLCHFNEVDQIRVIVLNSLLKIQEKVVPKRTW